MAPKRPSKSTGLSKGATKPTAPPTAGIRKSTRARGTSSEPRQLRSNSEEPQDVKIQDPEQIMRDNKRKIRQSSRASSRASTQEPEDIVVDRAAEVVAETSLSPVREAVNEPLQSSQFPPGTLDADYHAVQQSTASDSEREQSTEREGDQRPISIVRHSSVEFSVQSSVEVDSIAPSVEHVESTPFGYNQHNLSLIVEEPTEESILAQYAQPPRYTQQASASTIQYAAYVQETESVQYDNGTFAETAREPTFSSDAASPQAADTASRTPTRQETIDLTSDDDEEEAHPSRQTPIAANPESIDLMSDSEDEDEQEASPVENETFLEPAIKESSYRPSAQAQDETVLESVLESDDYYPAPLARNESQVKPTTKLSSGSEEEEEEDDHEEYGYEDQDDYEMYQGPKDYCSEATDEDELEGQYEDQFPGQHQMSHDREPLLEEDNTLTQAHRHLAEHEREYGQHQGNSTEHETQVSTPSGHKSSKGMFDIFHNSTPAGQGEVFRNAMATFSGHRMSAQHHLGSTPSTPAHQITPAYNPEREFTLTFHPDDDTIDIGFKQAIRELNEESALKKKQAAMEPPLTPASATRRPSNRLLHTPIAQLSKLNQHQSMQIETAGNISHLFNTSLIGYEDSEVGLPEQEANTLDGTEVVMLDQGEKEPNEFDHLFNKSLTGYKDVNVVMPDQGEEEPDEFDHLFNESLTSNEDNVLLYTHHNGKYQPSNIAASFDATKNATAAIDDTTASTMKNDDFSLSSPFNPTSTSTPLHMMQLLRQMPDNPGDDSDLDSDDGNDMEDEITLNYNEHLAERDVTIRNLLISTEADAFAATEITKHNLQTADPDCASCSERIGQYLVHHDDVMQMMANYREALIPLRDLDGNCYQDFVKKYRSFEKKIKSSSEENQALISRCQQAEKQVHALRDENYALDDEFLRLRQEAETAVAQNKELATESANDKALIQQLQGRIAHLQAQLNAKEMGTPNNPADFSHPFNQNLLLSLISADLSSRPTNDKGCDDHVPARALTNKSSAVSIFNSQVCSRFLPILILSILLTISKPTVIDDQFVEDPFMQSVDITPAKEDSRNDTTAMETSDSPEASQTPAASTTNPLNYLSWAVSPLKRLWSSPTKATSSPSTAKKVSRITKVDRLPPLKPNASMRQQKPPRTPVKSTQERQNMSRSVRFNVATPRADSGESKQAEIAQTPATSTLQPWSAYKARCVRARFLPKWEAFQLEQKARLRSGERETSLERGHREQMEYSKSLMDQALEHLRKCRAEKAAADLIKLSKKRVVEAMESTEGSPAKKPRLAFEQQRTTTPPGVERPVPGEDGYHTSTQLPSTGSNNWVSESARILPGFSKKDTFCSSQVFGASASIPGASLGLSSASQIRAEQEHQRSQGRTFEVPSDDEETSEEASIGRTYAFPDDDSSESEDDSVEDAQNWKVKPFNEWTQSTMAAYKQAPLPAGVVPAEQPLREAVDSIINGHCPDPIHAMVRSSDHPRVTQLGMTPDDFLTISYPDDRGVITYTRQSYYHSDIKPPGTEHMTPQQRAAWKCMEEFRNWRKFSEVVRLYQQDDTPAVVAQIDGRLHDAEKKRKRVEDEEQELARKEQELERREKRLEENEKQLNRRHEEQLQKHKAVAATAQPLAPARKPTFFNSLINDLEEQSQQVQSGSSSQQAAGRVTVPANAVRQTGQAPLSSVISPQNPPPHIYDASGKVILTTQPAAVTSTTTSAPAWTQSPPPAPTPAHAQLPPQVKTGPAPAPAVQPSNKYAPKKPSRLRESTTYSPGPNIQQSIEKDEDWRSLIPEPKEHGYLIGPGRHLTPPSEAEDRVREQGLNALIAMVPMMRREAGYVGGPLNLA